jgi:hypothetical protein
LFPEKNKYVFKPKPKSIIGQYFEQILPTDSKERILSKVSSRVTLKTILADDTSYAPSPEILELPG